jgi:hypothetical protein
MKFLDSLVLTTLVVGTSFGVFASSASAKSYQCLATKAGAFIVYENLSLAQEKEANRIGNIGTVSVDTAKMLISVRNRIPTCLYYSNEFENFNVVIPRFGTTIYTAKPSTVFFVPKKGQIKVLNNHRLVVTVSPYLPAPLSSIKVEIVSQQPLLTQ